MQPSEFWNLSLTEFWLEFDSKMREQKQIKKSQKTKPGITDAEWDKARKKFSEMNK